MGKITISIKRRAGRPARSGQRMKPVTVALPPIVLDALAADFGGDNPAAQVRGALFQYFYGATGALTDAQIALHVAAMKALLMVDAPSTEDITEKAYDEHMDEWRKRRGVQPPVVEGAA